VGVNYQPIPRKVYGIKRAVRVSAAEDYTLVLISTTIPPLDNVASFSSPISLPVSDEIDETLPYEQDYYGDDLVADRDDHPDQSHQKQQSKEIPTLQDMCQRIMSSSLNFKNILAALTFAEKYSLRLLFNYCLKFIAK
jgi:hypothetical protein